MNKIIPFHQHDFSSDEIRAVNRVLKDKWITGGPENIFFEKEISNLMKLRKNQEVVSMSSATAGLFVSLKLFGIESGDEVITSPYSFVATANVIFQCGAKPVFADIGLDYNLDPESVANRITPRTKAVIAVDYGGYPCDYQSLKKIFDIPFSPTNKFQEILGRPLILVDSAHSIGTFYPQAQSSDETNPYADIHCYSLHAVKNITCAEGGVVGVMNSSLIQAGVGKSLRVARLHGLNRDAYQREQEKLLFYDMEEMGYKCNLTEMSAALARAQLKRINKIKKKKMSLKQFYDHHFKKLNIELRPNNPLWKNWNIHPHLYTIVWEGLTPRQDTHPHMIKETFFRSALKAGVSLNFHYPPIPLLSYYRRRGYSLKHLPVTQALYPLHFSLPFYSKLSLTQANQVVSVIKKLIKQK